jgi:hypothetical protein
VNLIAQTRPGNWSPLLTDLAVAFVAAALKQRRRLPQQRDHLIASAVARGDHRRYPSAYGLGFATTVAASLPPGQQPARLRTFSPYKGGALTP